MESKIASWFWDVQFENDDAYELFLSEIATVSKLLKERLSIDKTAAEFLRKATRKDVNWELKLGHPKRLPLLNDCLIEIPANSDTLLPLPFNGPPVCDTWICNIEFEEYDYKKLIPKEAIFITKETSLFVKECIAGKVTLPKLERLIPKVEAGSFYVEITDFLSNLSYLTEERMLGKVPDSIEIPVDNDIEYINEDLSEDKTMTSHEMLSINIYQGNFQKIPSLEVFQIQELVQPDHQFIFQLSFPKFTYELPLLENSYFHAIESYILEEDLQKGVQYRIDAPFMSSAPTFKEHMSSFEFACAHPIPSLPACDERLPTFLSYVSTFDERVLLDETIETVELFDSKLANLGFDLKKISSFDIYIIKDTTSVITPSPEHDNTTTKESSIHTSKFQNSNIKVLEETAISTESEDTRTDDTLAATKMVTSINTTDLSIPNKRTLDDELDELINTKRKNVTHTEADSTMLPVLKLLRDQNPAKDPKDIIVQDETFIAPELPKSESLVPFKPQYDCHNGIIFNLHFINDHLSILSTLAKSTHMKVNEIDLGELGPDFVISATCGVLIINSSDTSQIGTDGKLKLQHKIQHNRKLFHNLHAIIVTEKSFNRESVSFLQLSLSLMGITSVIVNSEVHQIVDAVCTISHFEGSQIQDEEVELISDDVHQFLIACGINPLASLEVLKRVEFLELLSMDRSQMSRVLSDILTTDTINHISSLFSLSWSFDHPPHHNHLR